MGKGWIAEGRGSLLTIAKRRSLLYLFLLLYRLTSMRRRPRRWPIQTDSSAWRNSFRNVYTFSLMISFYIQLLGFITPPPFSTCQVMHWSVLALYRKLETYIPRNETARPRSQFLHSCIWEVLFGIPIFLYCGRELSAQPQEQREGQGTAAKQREGQGTAAKQRLAAVPYPPSAPASREFT